MVLNWTVFEENTAVKDSAVSLYGWSETPVIVSNSFFINNAGQKLLFSVNSSKVNFYNVTFTDNISDVLAHGF